MAGAATRAPGCTPAAAPARHPPNRSVPGALSRFDVRRPASTASTHPGTRATAPTIYRVRVADARGSFRPRLLDPEDLGRHVDRLFRAAWAMCGHPHDAEDLVQETYARVLARPRILRRGDEVGYLLRVLRNVHVSRHRAASARPQEVPLEDRAEMRDGRGRWEPEAALEVRALFAAISALPPDFRDVVVAVDVLGLSYAETARAVGAKESTVTTRLHRARTRLTEGAGRAAVRSS
jgi:RNA polymerase sigma-70 factor, ECF subfamily